MTELAVNFGAPTHWRYVCQSDHNKNPWKAFADEQPNLQYNIDYGYMLAPSQSEALLPRRNDAGGTA